MKPSNEQSATYQPARETMAKPVVLTEEEKEAVEFAQMVCAGISEQAKTRPRKTDAGILCGHVARTLEQLLARSGGEEDGK